MLGKKMKKLILLSALVSVLWGTGGLAIEASSNAQLKTKKVYFNDQAVTTTVIEQNGYQLVPATLFKQVGATVNWSAGERSAIISKGSNGVKLPVGARSAYYSSNSSKSWNMDGNLNTRTTLIGGKSYVPLAYTARKLGIQVQYDAKLRAARLLANPVGQQGNLTSNSVTTGNNKLLNEEDLYWLYQLTEAEAGGESYRGKLAVASTVFNRVEAEGWPDSVTEIIFEIVYVNGKAYYQFEPVLNEYIYKVTPSEETKRAVQAAINGEDPTNGAVVFYNPRKTSNAWILSRPITVTIGNHVFAR